MKVETTTITPHYSALEQGDVDSLAALVRRKGFGPVIAALGDILTQGPQARAQGQPTLSFCLGGAMAAAWTVDKNCPPAG